MAVATGTTAAGAGTGAVAGGVVADCRYCSSKSSVPVKKKEKRKKKKEKRKKKKEKRKKKKGT